MRRTIPTILIAFAGAYQAYAGPVPMPLEVHLDMAKDVAVGEITEIMESSFQPGNAAHWGYATVAVKETLKGVPAKIAKFLVVVKVDPGYGGSAILHPHEVGDSGIWLIRSDGVNDDSHGLLPENRKTEVQQILTALAERRWSDPVNGLQAWAAVVHPDYHPNPVIVFAVRNTSKADIFLPHESTPGFVTLTATSQDGKATRVTLRSGRQPERVFCNKLSSGEIRYLHPNYSFIDLSWPERRLPPGKYSIVVACKNTQEGEAAEAPGQTVQVAAWKGQLEAPPIEIVLAAHDTRNKDAQESAPAEADNPASEVDSDGVRALVDSKAK